MIKTSKVGWSTLNFAIKAQAQGFLRILSMTYLSESPRSACWAIEWHMLENPVDQDLIL